MNLLEQGRFLTSTAAVGAALGTFTATDDDNLAYKTHKSKAQLSQKYSIKMNW